MICIRKNHEKKVRLQQFKSIIAGYEQYKTYEANPGEFKNDGLDFTDMVQKYIDNGLLSFKILMVDEAQDLTPLQWDMVVKLAMNSQKVYLAGDDDQAIYEWNGADVSFFQSFPGKVKILQQSRRLNKKVHFFSRCILNGMEGYRIKKEFTSNGKDGEISKCSSLKKFLGRYKVHGWY